MISKNNKQKIIQQLLSAKQKAYNAEFALLISGNTQEANKIKDKGKILSRQIDNLISEAMSDWNGSTEALIKDVKSTNAKIQKSIAGIKKGVETAKQVVKVVGYIDDLIEVVSTIL